MLKAILRKPLRWLGYDIVRTGINNDLFLTMANLLRDRPQPVLFDVGANRGQTAKRLAETFSAGVIYSFEPTPAIFRDLEQESARCPRIKPFPFALGERSERTTFQVNQNSVTNSFLPVSSNPKAVSHWEHGYDPQEKIEVEVRRLDEFCSEHGVQQIDLLKADVQGWEMRVLEGAGSLLDPRSIRLVLLEVVFMPYYDGQSYFDELAGFLRQRGYKLVDLYEPVVHREHGLLQADALFFPAELAT